MKRHLAQLLVSNVGGNVLGFLSGVVMARLLGADGRGTYQTAAMFWAVVPGIISLSIGTAVVLQRHRPSGLWIFVVSSTLSLLGAVGALAAYYLNLVPPMVALILALTSFGYMTSDLCQGLLRRNKSYGRLSLYRWVDVGGGAVLIIIFGATGILTINTAVLALCASTVVAVAFGWISLCLQMRTEAVQLFHWKSVPGIHAGTVLRVFATWADQIAIAFFLGVGPLGVYAIANSMATQFMIIPSAMNTILLRASAESRQKGLSDLQTYTRIIVWLGITASGFFATLGPPLVALVFGNDFHRSAIVASVLVLGSTLSGLLLVAESYLIGQKGAGHTALARAVALPGMALGIVVLAFQPHLLVAAFIPIAGNLLPLFLVWKKIKDENALSFWDFVKFPNMKALLLLVQRRKQ